MFIAALFIIARKWEQLKCLSTDGIDKQNVEYHAMGYNSTTKRSKAHIHTTTWMTLERSERMLSQRSQAPHIVILFILNDQIGKSIEICGF